MWLIVMDLDRLRFVFFGDGFFDVFSLPHFFSYKMFVFEQKNVNGKYPLGL